MQRILLSLLLLLSACRQAAPESDLSAPSERTTAEKEIRLYEVRADQRALAIQTIERMKVSSVTAIDADTLAVLCSAQKHDQLVDVISAINDSADAVNSAQSSTILFKLWQLDEAPADASPATIPDELQGAVRAIQSEFGDAPLRLVDAAALTFLPANHAGTVSPRGLQIDLQDRDDLLHINLRTAHPMAATIQSVIPMRWGRFLVLSQSTIPVDGQNANATFRSYVVVQLVRSDEP